MRRSRLLKLQIELDADTPSGEQKCIAPNIAIGDLSPLAQSESPS